MEARTQLEESLSPAMAPGVRSWELRSDGQWDRLEGRDYQAELTRRIHELAG